MASILAVFKQRAAAAFRSAVVAHVGSVIPTVEQRIRSVLKEDEVAPDLRFLFILLGRLVDDVLLRLIEADKAHLDELTDDTEPRARRDQHGAKVRRKLVEIRSISEGLFGPQRSAEILATDGPTAQVGQPELLWRQAEHTASRLKDPLLQVPTATTTSLQFNPVQLGSELEDDLVPFRQALDDVELERREAELTLAAREELMSESDLVRRGCVRIAEGLFLLGNRPDLVQRLRRAVRRRRRSAPQDGEPLPNPGEDEPSASEEPGSNEPHNRS